MKLNKIIFLSFFLLGILNGECQSFISQEVYKSENLIIHKISKHAYLHISFLNTEDWGKVSCNGLIVKNGNEAVVFDTPTDNESSLELIQWINEELHCNIIAVIPTHYHKDNLGGLQVFHNQNIPSYSYKPTIDLAKKYEMVSPQNGFDSIMKLKIGNKKIYAEFLGEGHTKDNTIGYFPDENILFGGCLVKAIGSSKGNLEEANEKQWAETVEKVKAKYPNAQIVIPGHGEIGGIELLDYTIDLFK
jgi:metallo-beta-lactamase class B